MRRVLSFVSERQDALSADLRRYYGATLDEALNTWTAQDLSAAVHNLPIDSATVRAELGDRFDWNHLAANLAELVDIMHFWLHSEYAKWTYDPDDPANKGKPKSKPPKNPLIPPVAFRPESVHQERMTDYMQQIVDAAEDSGPTTEWVSSDEFDAWVDSL